MSDSIFLGDKVVNPGGEEAFPRQVSLSPLQMLVSLPAKRGRPRPDYLACTGKIDVEFKASPQGDGFLAQFIR
jgi:hypothetical protein